MEFEEDNYLKCIKGLSMQSRVAVAVGVDRWDSVTPGVWEHPSCKCYRHIWTSFSGDGARTMNKWPTLSFGRTEKRPWFVLLRCPARTTAALPCLGGTWQPHLQARTLSEWVPASTSITVALPTASLWPGILGKEDLWNLGRTFEILGGKPSSTCLFLFWWFIFHFFIEV